MRVPNPSSDFFTLALKGDAHATQPVYCIGNLAKAATLTGSGDRAVCRFTLISNEYAGKEKVKPLRLIKISPGRWPNGSFPRNARRCQSAGGRYLTETVNGTWGTGWLYKKRDNTHYYVFEIRRRNHSASCCSEHVPAAKSSITLTASTGLKRNM